MLAIAKTSTPPAENDIPAIGEKWPGTEAIYAGTALSINEDKLVHLILWPNKSDRMSFDAGVNWAEEVRPDMNSHIPTRHQSITLYERLQGQFNQDYYHWTLAKRKDGNTAFVQNFYYGYQNNYALGSSNLVRAVSEIPL